MRAPVIIHGAKLVSASRDGKKAQIRVDQGAYRGTYHCVKENGEWMSPPHPSTGDQYILRLGRTL